MRTVRTIGFTLLAALAPAMAVAQQPVSSGRDDFADSWYWGIKGGISSFDPDGLGRLSKPSIGGEWLITRRKAGLYISVDQSFFDGQAGIFDASVAGSVRTVEVSDWRRYSAGLYAFPVDLGGIRPYFGVGVTLNAIQSANPLGTFVSEDAQLSVYESVNEMASKASPTFTGGFQMNVGRTALFAQAVAMPTRNNFLISGATHTFLIEGGLRYNLASAIERLK